MNKKCATALVVAAGILWGIISLFINRLSDLQFSSAEISFLRVFTCAILMFVFLWVYDKRLLRIHLRDIWMFVGTGIVSLTLFSFCYFTTIIRVEASIAVSLLYTSPVFVMLLSALLFKERITPRKITASVVTVLGCALVSGMVGSSVKMGLLSLCIGIGSGFFYALYSIFGRYATGKYHSFTITFYTFAFASVGFLLFVRPGNVFRTLSASPATILYVIVWGIVCGVLPYVFYTAGLKHLETTVAGVLVAVEPLVGSLIGILCFQESANLPKLLGIALILSSIVFMSIEPKNNPKT